MLKKAKLDINKMSETCVVRRIYHADIVAIGTLRVPDKVNNRVALLFLKR